MVTTSIHFYVKILGQHEIVTIHNPSNLNISTSDLSKSRKSAVGFYLFSFYPALRLSRGRAFLGTVLLPNLDLNMGNNSFTATSAFQVGFNTAVLLMTAHESQG